MDAQQQELVLRTLRNQKLSLSLSLGVRVSAQQQKEFVLENLEHLKSEFALKPQFTRCTKAGSKEKGSSV